MSNDPRPSYGKELTDHPGHFRLWLGRDYRLVWLVLDDDQLVEIEYVGAKTPHLYQQLGLAGAQSE